MPSRTLSSCQLLNKLTSVFYASVLLARDNKLVKVAVAARGFEVNFDNVMRRFIFNKKTDV